MQRKSVLIEVNKLLDEWDPLGVLHQFKSINYSVDEIGGYSSYVLPVIQNYLANRSIEDYLIQLQTSLRNDPNERQKADIEIIAGKLVFLLSKYSKTDLTALRA